MPNTSCTPIHCPSTIKLTSHRIVYIIYSNQILHIQPFTHVLHKYLCYYTSRTHLVRHMWSVLCADAIWDAEDTPLKPQRWSRTRVSDGACYVESWSDGQVRWWWGAGSVAMWGLAQVDGGECAVSAHVVKDEPLNIGLSAPIAYQYYLIM